MRAALPGWATCGGFPDATPADVHPANIFEVTKQPIEGNSYLGMVVRDDNTWECISTRIRDPINVRHCYSFSIYLARSATYLSPTKKYPDKRVSFTIPIKLRIWGGNRKTKEKYLLAQSKPVSHLYWKKYEFTLRPKRIFDLLILEAMYADGVTPYNGHILVDNASALVRVDCSDE